MVNVTTRRETDMRDSRVNSARLRCSLLAILLALSGPVLWATTKGPDAGGYSGTDATVYSFVDIAGGSGGASVLAGSIGEVVAEYTFRAPTCSCRRWPFFSRRASITLTAECEGGFAKRSRIPSANARFRSANTAFMISRSRRERRSIQTLSRHITR